MANRLRTPCALLLLLLTVPLGCSASAHNSAIPAPSEAPATVVASPTPAPSPTDPQRPTTTASAKPTKTAPAEPTPTATTIPLPSSTATATPTPSPTATHAGPGCLMPPDDYSRVEINGEMLNARTKWMLEQAASLYDGPGDLLRVTQGSYSTGEATSFDTHAGGGAVDLSIRDPADPTNVLWDETDAMVLALRRAGFAAWYRAPGDLGPGSPAHIHAIAAGDQELSPRAVEQLVGPGGYFRGFDGLPPEYGGPHPDKHGGPIVCPWMIDLGYADLRE